LCCLSFLEFPERLGHLPPSSDRWKTSPLPLPPPPRPVARVVAFLGHRFFTWGKEYPLPPLSAYPVEVFFFHSSFSLEKDRQILRFPRYAGRRSLTFPFSVSSLLFPDFFPFPPRSAQDSSVSGVFDPHFSLPEPFFFFFSPPSSTPAGSPPFLPPPCQTPAAFFLPSFFAGESSSMTSLPFEVVSWSPLFFPPFRTRPPHYFFLPPLRVPFPPLLATRKPSLWVRTFFFPCTVPFS